MGATSISWDERTDGILLDRWHAGDTMQQIADRLGVSRSTISGRINRQRQKGVQFPPRVQEHARSTAQSRAKRRKMDQRNERVRANREAAQEKLDAEQLRRSVENPLLPPTVSKNGGRPPIWSALRKNGTLPETAAVPGTTCTTKFEDLKPGQCRYIEGADEHKLFCDAQAEAPGRSYCSTHAVVCYRVVDARPSSVAR